MCPIKIVHTADLHLGAPLSVFGDYAGKRQEDLLATFDAIIDLALELPADLVLVAGDLFNAVKVQAALAARVAGAFDKLSRRNIPAVLVPGTHDHLESQESVYRRYSLSDAIILDEPQVVEPFPLSVKGQEIYLYGFAYSHGRSAQALNSMRRRPGPGLHIGLLHCAVKVSPAWEVESKDIPVEEKELMALGLDYLALGHYHTYREFSKDGMVRACYPGSPEGINYQEPGDRFVAVVEVNNGEVKVTPRPVNRKIVMERRYDMTGLASRAELLNLLSKERDKRVILRAILQGAVEKPLDLSGLYLELQEEFAHLELLDNTSVYNSALIQQWSQERTIRGLFLSRLLKQMEESQGEETRQRCHNALKEVLAKFARLD